LTFSGTQQVAQQAAFYAVIVCWWVFAFTFWLRKRPPRAREAKRDWSSLLGLLLQAFAYGLVWFDPLRRRPLSFASSSSPVIDDILSLAAVLIAVLSVWLVNSAARQLGKQWALAARLVDQHELVQNGPYSFVRNPIYTGMLGMLIATGLVLQQWMALAIAIVVFLAGTYIRIRCEERLLREAFGTKFDEYASRVPALVPGIY